MYVPLNLLPGIKNSTNRCRHKQYTDVLYTVLLFFHWNWVFGKKNARRRFFSERNVSSDGCDQTGNLFDVDNS